MNNTQNLVMQLKQAGQDFEWYPTNKRMINLVLQHLPSDAGSILDVGAGDGRVLQAFKEKCKSAKLYSIEISPILIQAQPDDIIPIGCNLHEQNLASLQVDYLFSNPIYSQYEDWSCKIISEGYARKAFLIIPQRWKDSEKIKEALKLRGASTSVIGSDDFLDADRQARAVVDIVEVYFPKDRYGSDTLDPFSIWFDQNVSSFEKKEESPLRETASEHLAKKHKDSSIDDIVFSYNEDYARLHKNYQAIFQLDRDILRELNINKDNVRDGLKLKMQGLKSRYWKLLFDRLDAITSRLTTDSKKALLEKLTTSTFGKPDEKNYDKKVVSNTSVEFTASNAYSIVLWAIKNANKYFDGQLIKLFRDLSTFEGVENYKSNTKTWVNDDWKYTIHDFRREATSYKLDYRIVLETSLTFSIESYEQYSYPGGLYQARHDFIADVIAVMGNLGFYTNSQRSTERTWEPGKWEDFYRTGTNEILFQTKVHKKGTMHFRFLPEAIRALNIEAGRLLKWVRSKDEVVTEMGYTPQEAEQYFKRNSHILPGSVKLLAAPKSE